MTKSNLTIVTLVVIILAFAGVSCNCETNSKEDTQAATVNEEPKAVLRHVVAFTFKDEVSDERQKQAVKDFMDLKNQIPGIISFEGGKDVSIEGFTKGLTHCFVVTFESEKARDEYIPHPAHLALVDKNKPLMTDLLVLDYWGEE